jgi:hypothetical protein
MDIPVIILTRQQLAKKKYYEKMKNDPKTIETRRIVHKKYYDKIKNDVTFKEKVSIQKRQYYIDKKEKLFQIIV